MRMVGHRQKRHWCCGCGTKDRKLVPHTINTVCSPFVLNEKWYGAALLKRKFHKLKLSFFFFQKHHPSLSVRYQPLQLIVWTPVSRKKERHSPENCIIVYILKIVCYALKSAIWKSLKSTSRSACASALLKGAKKSEWYNWIMDLLHFPIFSHPLTLGVE